MYPAGRADQLHSTMQIAADDTERERYSQTGCGWGGWRGVDRLRGEWGADQVRNIDLTGLEPPILAQILQTQFHPAIHPAKRPFVSRFSTFFVPRLLWDNRSAFHNLINAPLWTQGIVINI